MFSDNSKLVFLSQKRFNRWPINIICMTECSLAYWRPSTRLFTVSMKLRNNSSLILLLKKEINGQFQKGTEFLLSLILKMLLNAPPLPPFPLEKKYCRQWDELNRLRRIVRGSKTLLNMFLFFLCHCCCS